jgi:hypothetical protein
MFGWDRDSDKAEAAQGAGEAAAGAETTDSTRFTSQGTIPPVATGDHSASGPSASDLAFGATASMGGLLGEGVKLGMKKWFGKDPGPVVHGTPHDKPSADRPPTPPEYAALDPDLIEKLWRSRKVNWALKGKSDEDFWKGVAAIGTADLHSLVATTRGAKALGLWDSIDLIYGAYTYPGSSGIKFAASGTPPMPAGQWGKDLQEFVAKEHKDGEKYTWFRNNSGAGNPGMHMGLDNGAGELDLHWDPTNPMQAVGTGSLQLIDSDLAGPVPVVVPKGQAIYSPAALAQHAVDIGYVGKKAQKYAGKKNSSDEMLEMSLFAGRDDVPNLARKYAQLEDADTHVKDRSGLTPVLNDIRRFAGILDAITAANRALAMQDDAHAIDEMYKKFETARDELFKALAALVKHLRSEVANPPDVSGYDTASGWENRKDGSSRVGAAEEVITGLQKKRADG